MNLGQAIRSGFVNYINFRDRACRSEFWYWNLFICMLGRWPSTISDLFTLVTLVPSVAVTVRRLHDINRSGWWALVFYIPFAAVWVATNGADGINRTGSWVLLIGLLIGSIFLIVVGCIQGTDGPNRFGPNPLANQLSGQTCPETRQVARVKANDGYFKKCSACGKFTRGAKVCRLCGRDLTDRVIDAPAD
jgi:uncharacterized membrane protein YhaH (DUF805 family)